jgi:hypothetical protein
LADEKHGNKLKTTAQGKPKQGQQLYKPMAASQLPRDGRKEPTAFSESKQPEPKNELTVQNYTSQDKKVLATLLPTGYEQSARDAHISIGK